MLTLPRAYPPHPPCAQAAYGGTYDAGYAGAGATGEGGYAEGQPSGGQPAVL
jgi:hypothetical protein